MVGYNPFSLQGKTILVTGASSGIGRATAIECSYLGAKLFVTARNEERLRETFDALEGDGLRWSLRMWPRARRGICWLDPYRAGWFCL